MNLRKENIVRRLTFPLKIRNKEIHKKEYIYLYKKNRLISEISTLPGLHENISIQELEKQYSKNTSTRPEIKFSKSMATFFRNHPIPKNITTAFLCTPAGVDLQKEGIFKLKVGRDDLEKENKTLIKLTQNPRNSLRIDGNKSCTAEMMAFILKGINLNQIDYIEDSFISIEEELKFHNLHPQVKLAMDEEIVRVYRSKAWNSIPDHINHVVLKLSLIGGIDEFNEIAINLQRKGCTLNLSSTFESEIGLKFLSEISRRAKYKNITMPGLDTLKYLK